MRYYTNDLQQIQNYTERYQYDAVGNIEFVHHDGRGKRHYSYEEDSLIENAATLGKYLGEALEDIKERHPSVGDVRYIGLFSAIELVTNRETKKPFSPAVMADVKKTLMDNGLFTFIMVKDIGTVIFIVPPLCIDQEQLAEGLALVEKALEVADKQVK